MGYQRYDFTPITQAIDAFLYQNLPPTWAFLAEMVIIGIVFLAFYAVVGLYLVFAERRVCALMQNRIGPNRVGPFGLLQTIADLFK